MPSVYGKFHVIFRRIFPPIIRSFKYGLQLKISLNRTKRIRKSDILLFVCVRNEKWRMPFFLDYYRKLGVGHFLIVDNDSDDGLQEYLQLQDDCSCWHTAHSYKKSNFGMDWLNSLLRRFGTGHWCLTCDPDEFLVYPHCETRNLHDLTEFLRGEKRSSLFCVMLDMYSEKPVSESHCGEGQNPLEVAPYFDRSGYLQSPNPRYGNVFVQGGVRRRMLFTDTPQHSPAINKTPLIFWRRHYAYISSMHMTSMVLLNRPHGKNYINPTGCILHFKMLSSLVQKVEEEMQRKQHYGNSQEYKKYGVALDAGRDTYFSDVSERYRDSRQLIELGLMTNGKWF